MASTSKVLDILEGAQIEPPRARAIARAIEEAEKEIAQDVKDVLDERLRYFATKADIADLESRLTTKLLTYGLGSTGITLGGVYFLLAHFKP